MDPRPPIPWRQRARLLRDLGIIVFGLWGLLRQSLRSAFRGPRSSA